MASAALKNGYPVSYRHHKNPARGFQTSGAPGGRPANRNLPRPANDNSPFVRRPKVPFGRKTTLPKGAFAGLPSAFLRANPWVRAGRLAYELYEMYTSRAAQPAFAGYVVPSGWHECIGLSLCDLAPDVHWVGTNSSCGTSGPGNGCLPNQANPGAVNGTDPGTVPESTRAILFGWRQPNPSRYTFTRRIVRPSTSVPANPAPKYEEIPEIPAIWEQPVPLQLPWPGADPFSLPINNPAPTPRPRPVRAPHTRPRNNPWRVEQPVRGYGPRPAPRPGPRLADTVIITPGQGVQKQPNAYRATNPPAATRERKYQGRHGAIVAMLVRAVDLYDKADELDQAIHEIFKALPKDCRKGVKGAIAEVQAIYTCFDRIDGNQAIENLLWNHLEDAVIGDFYRRTRLPIDPNRPSLRFGPAI